MTMIRLSAGRSISAVLSILLSLGLACGGGAKEADTTPADTGGGDGAAAGGETAGGAAAGGEAAGGAGETGGEAAKPAGPTAAEQVAQGEKVWGDACSTCHGPAGEGKGKKNPPVVGAKALPKHKNAAELEAFIKEKMPKDDPGSLSDADAWAVTAWILSKNAKLGDAALTAESAASVSIH
jgi:mono/diheme cytochrome c family protein